MTSAVLPLFAGLPSRPGLAYRVQCYREGFRSVCGLSEWHDTLASALRAVADHQQRPWSSVALVPQVPAPAPDQAQLGLAWSDTAGGQGATGRPRGEEGGNGA